MRIGTIITYLLFLLCTQSLRAQTVVITDDSTYVTGQSSAVLDLKSTSKGLLPPRVTAAQKAAISSPATGLVVYQTDDITGFYYYNGSAWTNLKLNSDSTNAVTGYTTLYQNSLKQNALGFTPMHGYYGQFYDTTSQTALLKTATAMKLGVTDIAESISIENGTRIKVANAGVYNLQFSAQIRRTGNGSDTCTIWFRKNGVDVSNSATDLVFTGAWTFVAAWNFMVYLQANEYLEIFWSVTDVAVSIIYNPPRSAPERPGIPSLIVTMQQAH